MIESTSSTLKQAAGALTACQRKAAMWDKGPLLVLAGPGSGKTRVLTCRIARILDGSRDSSFRILGLTFTNKAADEMRERVERLVPGLERRLFLGTFHSFCAEVLRQHGTHLGIKPNFRIYSSQEDREALLQEAVRKSTKGGQEVGRKVTAFLRVIDRLKAGLVSPDEVGHVFPDQDAGNRVGIVYEAYEETLRAHNTLDFNSLIYYACELFRRFPAFAKRYRTVYPHWCVDEFQDTNAAQYAFLKSMAAGRFENIFVVADDDQIIYQWNGASHKRIQEYKTDFSPDVIQLPTNFRCPPQIVKIANKLIRHNVLRTTGKQPLVSGKRDEDPSRRVVRLRRFTTDAEEAGATASDIATRPSGHLRTVAVLARNRRLLETLHSELREAGIQSVIAQRRDDFASAPFVWMQACLRQSNHRNDPRNLEALAGSFGQVAGVHVCVEDLIGRAEATHQDYLREWADTVGSLAECESARTAAREVSKRLMQAGDFREFISFATAWFDRLISDQEHPAGLELFEGYEQDRIAWATLGREILPSIGNSATLERFLHELELRSKEPPLGPSTVALMTIHGAKGKEFDHVYLIGLAEDIIPSYQSRLKGDDSPEMEEERRNCFVAITRAKETLSLSYASSYRGWRKEPSRFLSEMEIEP